MVRMINMNFQQHQTLNIWPLIPGSLYFCRNQHLFQHLFIAVMFSMSHPLSIFPLNEKNCIYDCKCGSCFQKEDGGLCAQNWNMLQSFIIRFTSDAQLEVWRWKKGSLDVSSANVCFNVILWCPCCNYNHEYSDVLACVNRKK